MIIGKSVKKYFLSSVVLAAAVVSVPASAARLSSGTLLSIDAGVIAPTACLSGSCFSMELIPGFTVWTALESGTDGGIILGKDQLSGGQETGTESATNAMLGQITKAFYFFSNYGTIGTAPMTGSIAGVITSDSSLNFFDTASCTGAACKTLVALGTWNVGWAGMAAPMGSAGGCLSTRCSADQLSGIFVSNWTVNTDKTYVLDYSQVVPDGHPSGFGSVPFSMHLSGTITPATPVNLPPVASNVQLTGASGTVLTWTPVVTDPDNGPNPLTCTIGTPPANGTATVAANCSSGSYVSEAGFSGVDSFTYVANDGQANSNVATVTAGITGTPSTACTQQYPVRQVTYTSKSKITLVLTGNIRSNSNKEVKICPTTRLDYRATSPAPYNYPVTCYITGVVAPATGSVGVGQQLKCNVRPYASDEYRLNIKSAI